MDYVFFIYLCPRLEREIDNQNRFNRDYSHLKCYILEWRLRKINYQKVIEKMKKLFLVAAFAMVSAFASAQFAVGVHTLYGTDVANLGIGVRARYDINDQFRADGNFNYYFKTNGLEFWDLNANLHYLFNITDRFSAYPLGGLGYVNWKHTYTGIVYDNAGRPYTGEVSTSGGKLGINLGGGVDFGLTEDLYLNGEVKYQIVSGYNQAVFSAGIVYKF